LAAADKATLTRKLEALEGGPGFTGDKPGGPSRWATERSSEWTPLKPNLVVEVSFDHVSGGRFRHGTRLLRFGRTRRRSSAGWTRSPKSIRFL
jgi:ATP-dependent DNA ligase